jgi:hypothetical protein
MPSFAAYGLPVLLSTASPSGCPFDIPCGLPSRTERSSDTAIGHFLRFA